MAPAIKSLLSDLGGVLLSSPMLAITAYESTHSLPSGYLNYAIAHSHTWSLLERGRIPLDQSFFTQFTLDLKNPSTWKAYREKLHHNHHDSKYEGFLSPNISGETLFWSMMSASKEIDKVIYHAYKTIKDLKLGGVEILGALTNDYPFPSNHSYSSRSKKIRELFDVFIRSSEVGMRKPQKEVYEFAVERLNEESIKKGFGEVKPEEIVFLDDIGINLKGARDVGLKTIKVELGATWKAVLELERMLGLEKGILLESDMIERLKMEGKWVGDGKRDEKTESKL